MFPAQGSLSVTVGEFMTPMTAALLSDPTADSQMPANTRGRAKSKHTQVVLIQILSPRRRQDPQRYAALLLRKIFMCEL